MSEAAEGTQEPVYLSVDEVLALYAIMVGTPEGDARRYHRDFNLLESALARPRHAAFYEGAVLVRQAATLLFGLLKSHPFLDGNKRIAYVATDTFLRVNGSKIQAADDEKFDFVIQSIRATKVDGVEEWLRAHPVEIGRN